KYSYQKGGNTSVVTAAEAKKEAVQVYKDIRQTTKEVIEPQTKKYTTTDAKTNNILLNLKNEASKFIGLFNKTSGSLEDRAKQACKSTLSWVDDNLQLIAAVGLLLATVGIIVASGGIATAALLPTLAEIGGTIASTSGTMAMVGSGIAITSGSLQVITGLFEHSLDGNKLSNAEGKSRYEAGAMNALLGGLTFFGGSFVKDIGQAILLGHYFNSTTNVSEPINNIRPTPRESELEMYRIENISIEDQQKTYLNGKLTNNNAKLKGSSIPDATVIKVNTAYEVKNYDLKYSSQLINNICTQIKQRVNNLPFKMKQHIYIDVRGQTYNLKDLEIIRKKIIEKNDADIEIIVSFITNEGVK
ncbi:MAG: hypothetical protein J6F30_02015, partial [Cellulosilyticum sp.]|nr:hypothetical protein [Cellulosilyticum sp.]